MQLFEKFLTQVDVERRLAVPIGTFRDHFELPRDRHYVDLLVKDSTGKVWTFRCSSRQTGNHPKPVFSAGWLDFVRVKGLQINDQVVFHKQRDEASEAEFKIEVKRRISSLMGKDIWVDLEQAGYYRSGN
ncbi:hypothetical protein SLE2022_355210 [Rubroshorea leprosula]